jgi:choline/glycine/proline betaine transport protein
VSVTFFLGAGLRADEDESNYFQAEVFLREGGQNYDVMDWTQEDLIQDIIDQYERHLYFLNIVRGSTP